MDSCQQCDSDQQKCTITFAWAEVVLMDAQEFNTGSIAGISLAVITCASPLLISLESIQEILIPMDTIPFAIPIYCIVCNCAHHSPNKHQTFSSEYERAHYWNKYHRDILDYFLEADRAYLTFLGLKKCPFGECNYVCFDEQSALINYQDVHSECGSASSTQRYLI